jgi:hypothetical protein
VHPISIFLKERHFRRFNILIFVRLVWHHFNKNFRSIFHFVKDPHKKTPFFILVWKFWGSRLNNLHHYQNQPNLTFYFVFIKFLRLQIFFEETK